MSKERGAFVSWYGNNPEQDEKGNYVGAFTQARWETWQSCASHYQPLLAAKDAEIADWEKTAKDAQDAWEDLHRVALQRDAENTTLKTQLEARDAEIAGLKESTGNACILAMGDEVLRLTKENTTLKALLEQAREALQESALPHVSWDGDRAEIEKVIEVINAATGKGE